jgi:hypothetical protein
MSATTTIPATVQLRRSRLVGLMTASAALAAGITCVLLIFVVHHANQGAPAGSSVSGYVDGVAAATPAQLAAAFGTPRVSLLSSLDPADRAFVQGIVRSTPTELVAAFGNEGVAPLDYDFYSSPSTTWNAYVQGIVSSSPEELAAAFGG